MPSFSDASGIHGQPPGFPTTAITGPFRSTAIAPVPADPANFRFSAGNINFNRGRFHHHPRRFVVVPVYVPGYVYPIYPYGYSEEILQQDEEPVAAAPEPEPPARTIFERRSTIEDSGAEAAALNDSQKQPAAPSSAAEAGTKSSARQSPDDLLPGTVLVFRDGSRKEVHDYAIMGGNLFDLDTAHVMKKIPLAMLDLDATRKENDENGVDFRLP